MARLGRGRMREEDDFTAKSVFVNRPERSLDSPLRVIIILFGLIIFGIWLFPNFYWPNTKTGRPGIDEKMTESSEQAKEANPLEAQNEESGQEQEKADQYLSDIKVGEELMVAVAECPIYNSEGLDSTRVSSALLAEKLRVITVRERGDRLLGTLEDGTNGWFDIANLTRDFSISEPEGLVSTVMVKQSMKRVMSHSIAGNVLMDVPMGTILYADYSGADIMRLRLPGKQEGWVSQAGLSPLDEEEDGVDEEERKRFFASSAMNFYGSRYLPGGMSKEGADMAGVVFISARVNGLTLPRNLEEQAKMGQSAEIIRDVTSNLPRPSLFEVGDVLYFHDGSSRKKISFAAVMLEKSKALTCLPNDSTLVLRDLEQETDLLTRLVTVRRFFP